VCVDNRNLLVIKRIYQWHRRCVISRPFGISCSCKFHILSCDINKEIIVGF
jgi:hypothetical protein